MKIDGTESGFHIPNSEKNRDRIDQSDHSFRDIFRQTVKPDTSPGVGPAATTFVHRLAPLTHAESIKADRQQTVERVECLLDMLDEYCGHLSRPTTDLRTLDGLVKQIEGQRETLKPLINELPDGDELKSILNTSLVTASVEIFKFQRGDYIAA